MNLRRRLFVAIVMFPVLLSAQTPAPAPATPGGSYPVMSAAAQSRARQLFGYLESGQSAQLYVAFTPELKKVNTSTKLAASLKELSGQMGREQKMLGENFAPDILNKSTVYSRYSQFSKSKEPVFTVVVLDEQGQVVLIQPRPTPPAPGNRFVDYKTATKLKLPFSGEWFVYQGGREPYQNANAYRDAERYSDVFTVLKDGRAFTGDGTKNEQFYCYGQPVAAPADGTVVMVNDTFADNAPGRPEQVAPNGNRVLISHGNKEYSLLLHLKQNSVKVKTGDKVKQGDVVAECGNSGASPAPHLEYRLQNSKGVPYPYTVPARFVDYVADGKPVESGEPLRGQLVHNTGTAAPPAADK